VEFEDYVTEQGHCLGDGRQCQRCPSDDLSCLDEPTERRRHRRTEGDTMTEKLEDELRQLFAADAEYSPAVIGLAEYARRRVHRRNRSRFT
jgi:coenzyme F420-reducing hydrogenase gamma subunit